MVVTNSYFTRGAKQLAHSTGCELIDRDILAEWILDYQQDGRNDGAAARPEAAEPADEGPHEGLRESVLAMLGPRGWHWIDNAFPFVATLVFALVFVWFFL
jgi:hypothetical protein